MKEITKQMLTALLKSLNNNCASTARRILENETTVEAELRYSGSFMTAVLEGNVDEACKCADNSNYEALERDGIAKVKFY